MLVTSSPPSTCPTCETTPQHIQNQPQTACFTVEIPVSSGQRTCSTLGPARTATPLQHCHLGTPDQTWPLTPDF